MKRSCVEFSGCTAIRSQRCPPETPFLL
ncbi:MAG TPA: hypothetical protein DIT89_07005 [Planctomycetaceae bacterium]|nr:hypothetical protein [Planctomycetaceae bacterium]